MGEVADEVNQLPTALHASVLAAARKCRHSREAHAILDDPEQFAVGKILRCRLTQIRWLGVEAASNRGLTAAVVGVTDGAMIREMQLRIAQILRRGEQGILRQPSIRRDRQMTRVASEHDFESIGSGASTEAVMQDGDGHSDNHAEERYSDGDHEGSDFHGSVNMLMDEGWGGQRGILRRCQGSATSAFLW